MTTLKFTSNKPENTKPVSNWHSRDFLIYFCDRYKKHTGAEFKIPAEAWVPMMSRIKGFIVKQKMTPETYKTFVDSIFDKFFTRDGYVPAFGAVVSDKVFEVIKHYKEPSVKRDQVVLHTNTEFEALKDDLYNNNILFRKFQ